MRLISMAALLVLGVVAAVPAAAADTPSEPAETLSPLPLEVPAAAPESPDCTASALPLQGNAPNGPLGPPPVPPGGSCEARCIQEFASCQQICSRNPCLISCETVYEICTGNCP